MSPGELLGFANKQFDWQYPVLTLYQTLAENFYPERADFTVTRNVGDELSDNLINSYPIPMRRDLCNSFSSMLRDGDWFKVGVNGEADQAGKSWLDWSGSRLRKIMYDRQANFVRSTKEADHDYGTFGNAVISVEPNRKYNGLLYRAWHLRDCAWWDDENGQVCGVIRKWKPTHRMLYDFFGEDKLHRNITKGMPKSQLNEADIYHILIPTETYGDDNQNKYVSIYLDVANAHIIEEVPTDNKMYVVPRFQTISGSPYAISPAAITALPDARMIQSMTYTLMEAGERYTRPPLIATEKVIRSDVDLSADGITYVSDTYDEKMGAALRPLMQDRGGYPIGINEKEGIMEVIASAFYINKLSLPDVNRDMTAYEVQERMKQYRRENLPLFAPIESEYNGQLCEESFRLAMQMGMLGSEKDVPESLLERDIVFKFESPLSSSEEEKKATQFRMVAEMLGQAVALDDGVSQNINFDEALRDAVSGIGAPQKWLNSVEQVMQVRTQVAQEQAAMAQQQADQQ